MPLSNAGPGDMVPLFIAAKVVANATEFIDHAAIVIAHSVIITSHKGGLKTSSIRRCRFYTPCSHLRCLKRSGFSFGQIKRRCITRCSRLLPQQLRRLSKIPDLSGPTFPVLPESFIHGEDDCPIIPIAYLPLQYHSR